LELFDSELASFQLPLLQPLAIAWVAH